eukprot:921256-Rhodomonas_salina.1
MTILTVVTIERLTRTRSLHHPPAPAPAGRRRADSEPELRVMSLPVSHGRARVSIRRAES